MANCTNVGQPGTSISLVPNGIPANVPVVLSGYAQSAAGQTAQVKDAKGNVVATISCKGNNGALQSMGMATFTTPNVSPPMVYTVSITNTGSQTSQVLSDYTTVSFTTTTYFGVWTFISEDTPNGGDCDFNDSTVFLSWNLSAG